jgi:two-component system sensor histidine kinase KdpD
MAAPQAKFKGGSFRDYWQTLGTLAAVSGLGAVVQFPLGYRAVGFFFLAAQLLLGLFYPFGPVLLNALLSALVWEYFFVPPSFTLAIGNPEDIFLVAAYILSAVVTGVLAQRFRRNQKLLLEKQRSEELYEAILNSVSHDLRTPLTSLLGSAEALKKNVAFRNPRRRKALLAQVSESGRRLDWVIEDLLGLARLQSGMLAPKLQWQDPAEMLHLVLQEAKGPLGGHKVRLKLARELPLVEVDYGLFKHALSNVLFNAAAYTPAGSPIEIKAKAEKDFLRLSVADQGPGIPDESLSRIFDKFYRVPGTKGAGTGMGLYIARNFLRAQQGDLTAENRDGRGAVFTLSLPLKEKGEA